MSLPSPVHLPIHPRKLRASYRRQLTPSAWWVLCGLAEYASEADTCFVSVARIARENRMALSTVRQYIGELVSKGFIRRTDRPGRSNFWELLLDPYDLRANPNAQPAREHRPHRLAGGVPTDMAEATPPAGRCLSDESEATKREEPTSPAQATPVDTDIGESVPRHTAAPASVHRDRPALHEVADLAVVDLVRIAVGESGSATPDELKAARELRQQVPTEELAQLVRWAAQDRQKPRPGKTWVGWSAVVRAGGIAALARNIGKVRAAMEEARERGPSPEELAAVRTAWAHSQLARIKVQAKEAEEAREQALANPNPAVLAMRAAMRVKLQGPGAS